MRKVPENVIDYNAKSTACLSKVKRIFVLTLALTFGAMFAMYSTSSGNTEQITMASFKTSGSAMSQFVSRHLNQINSYINRNTSGFYSKSVETSISDDISKGVTMSTIQRSYVVSNSSVEEKKILEFPEMPDPCAEPRRNTGVEDILCMERPKFLPNYKNPCWYDNGVFRCLPYFHLFGVCKSGTSDLFKRILLHPELVPNKGIFGKEIWYWSWNRFATNTPSGRKKPGMTLKEFTSKFYADRIKNKNDSNGYHHLITGHGDPMDFWDRFAEDKTPQNTPGAEELLWTTPYSVRHINPDVRLLLMLRDPIDRLYSHYFHSGAGTSAKSFDDHIRISITHWKECLLHHSARSCVYNKDLRKKLKAPIYSSFYSIHMKEWLKAFPRSQIHVMRNEDYAADTETTLKGLFKFLDVDSSDDQLLKKMVSLPHFYQTEKKKKAGPMLESTKQLLIDLYRPYMEELTRILGDEKFAFKDASFR